MTAPNAAGQVAELKVCRGCQQEKPLTEFRMRRAQCRPCLSESERLYRARISPDARRRHGAAYRKRHRAHLTAKQRAYREANRIKDRAREAVKRAIRTGRLVRPASCANCGIACKPEASHDDYRRPLDVEWLCAPCHRRKDGNADMFRRSA